jgi:hypothetical protein
MIPADPVTILGVGLTILGIGGPITAAIFKYGPSSDGSNGHCAPVANQAQIPTNGNGKQQYMPRDLCEERSGHIRSDMEEMKETQERMWIVLNEVHKNSQENMRISQETMRLLAQQRKENNGHG